MPIKSMENECRTIKNHEYHTLASFSNNNQSSSSPENNVQRDGNSAPNEDNYFAMERNQNRIASSPTFPIEQGKNRFAYSLTKNNQREHITKSKPEQNQCLSWIQLTLKALACNGDVGSKYLIVNTILLAFVVMDYVFGILSVSLEKLSEEEYCYQRRRSFDSCQIQPIAVSYLRILFSALSYYSIRKHYKHQIDLLMSQSHEDFEQMKNRSQAHQSHFLFSNSFLQQETPLKINEVSHQLPGVVGASIQEHAAKTFNTSGAEPAAAAEQENGKKVQERTLSSSGLLLSSNKRRRQYMVTISSADNNGENLLSGGGLEQLVFNEPFTRQHQKEIGSVIWGGKTNEYNHQKQQQPSFSNQEKQVQTNQIHLFGAKKAEKQCELIGESKAMPSDTKHDKDEGVRLQNEGKNNIFASEAKPLLHQKNDQSSQEGDDSPAPIIPILQNNFSSVGFGLQSALDANISRRDMTHKRGMQPAKNGGNDLRRSLTKNERLYSDFNSPPRGSLILPINQHQEDQFAIASLKNKNLTSSKQHHLMGSSKNIFDFHEGGPPHHLPHSKSIFCLQNQRHKQSLFNVKSGPLIKKKTTNDSNNQQSSGCGVQVNGIGTITGASQNHSGVHVPLNGNSNKGKGGIIPAHSGMGGGLLGVTSSKLQSKTTPKEIFDIIKSQRKFISKIAATQKSDTAEGDGVLRAVGASSSIVPSADKLIKIASSKELMPYEDLKNMNSSIPAATARKRSSISTFSNKEDRGTILIESLNQTVPKGPAEKNTQKRVQRGALKQQRSDLTHTESGLTLSYINLKSGMQPMQLPGKKGSQLLRPKISTDSYFGSLNMTVQPNRQSPLQIISQKSGYVPSGCHDNLPIGGSYLGTEALIGGGCCQNTANISYKRANPNPHSTTQIIQQRNGANQNTKSFTSSFGLVHNPQAEIQKKKIKKLEKQLTNTKIFLNMVIHDLRNPTNSITFAIKEIIKLLNTPSELGILLSQATTTNQMQVQQNSMLNQIQVQPPLLRGNSRRGSQFIIKQPQLTKSNLQGPLGGFKGDDISFQNNSTTTLPPFLSPHAQVRFLSSRAQQEMQLQTSPIMQLQSNQQFQQPLMAAIGSAHGVTMAGQEGIPNNQSSVFQRYRYAGKSDTSSQSISPKRLNSNQLTIHLPSSQQLLSNHIKVAGNSATPFHLEKLGLIIKQQVQQQQQQQSRPMPGSVRQQLHSDDSRSVSVDQRRSILYQGQIDKPPIMVMNINTIEKEPAQVSGGFGFSSKDESSFLKHRQSISEPQRLDLLSCQRQPMSNKSNEVCVPSRGNGEIDNIHDDASSDKNEEHRVNEDSSEGDKLSFEEFPSVNMASNCAVAAEFGQESVCVPSRGNSHVNNQIISNNYPISVPAGETKQSIFLLSKEKKMKDGKLTSGIDKTSVNKDNLQGEFVQPYSLVINQQLNYLIPVGGSEDMEVQSRLISNQPQQMTPSEVNSAAPQLNLKISLQNNNQAAIASHVRTSLHHAAGRAFGPLATTKNVGDRINQFGAGLLQTGGAAVNFENSGYYSNNVHQEGNIKLASVGAPCPVAAPLIEDGGDLRSLHQLRNNPLQLAQMAQQSQKSQRPSNLSLVINQQLQQQQNALPLDQRTINQSKPSSYFLNAGFVTQNEDCKSSVAANQAGMLRGSNCQDIINDIPTFKQQNMVSAMGNNIFDCPHQAIDGSNQFETAALSQSPERIQGAENQQQANIFLDRLNTHGQDSVGKGLNAMSFNQRQCHTRNGSPPSGFKLNGQNQVRHNRNSTLRKSPDRNFEEIKNDQGQVQIVNMFMGREFPMNNVSCAKLDDQLKRTILSSSANAPPICLGQNGQAALGQQTTTGVILSQNEIFKNSLTPQLQLQQQQVPFVTNSNFNLFTQTCEMKSPGQQAFEYALNGQLPNDIQIENNTNLDMNQSQKSLAIGMGMTPKENFNRVKSMPRKQSHQMSPFQQAKSMVKTAAQNGMNTHSSLSPHGNINQLLANGFSPLKCRSFAKGPYGWPQRNNNFETQPIPGFDSQQQLQQQLQALKQQFVMSLDKKKLCEQWLQNSLLSSSMLLNLINDLLDLAKMENSQFKLNTTQFNLHEVIQKALDTLEFQASQKTIKMEYNFEAENVGHFLEITGDDNRYLQILLNFLSNSLKFTPKEGKITVDLRLLETQEIKANPTRNKDSNKNVLNLAKDAAANAGGCIPNNLQRKTLDLNMSAINKKRRVSLKPSNTITKIGLEFGVASQAKNQGQQPTIGKMNVSHERNLERNSLFHGKEDLSILGHLAVKGKCHAKVEKFIKFQIRIEDSGQGISPEGLNKLFMNFGKLDEHAEGNKSGTGLGLSICKTLIEKMGGSVTVESEVGKGSTFIVELQTKCIHPGNKMSRKWLNKYFQRQAKGKSNAQNSSSQPGNFGGAGTEVIQSEIIHRKTFAANSFSQANMYPSSHIMSESSSINNILIKGMQKHALKERMDSQQTPLNQYGKTDSLSPSFQLECHNNSNRPVKIQQTRTDSKHPESQKQNLQLNEGSLYDHHQANQNESSSSSTSHSLLSPEHDREMHQSQLTFQAFGGIAQNSTFLNRMQNVSRGYTGKDKNSGATVNFNQDTNQYLEGSIIDCAFTPQYNQQVKHYRALVANDDQFQLEIISAIFNQCGFEVDQAENGLVAVQKVLEKGSQQASVSPNENQEDSRGLGGYDVVILDLDMPIMNGFEACQKLRQRDQTADLAQLFQVSRKNNNNNNNQGARDNLKHSADEHSSERSHHNQQDSGVAKAHAKNKLFIVAVSALITEAVIEKGLKYGFDSFIETPITEAKIRETIFSRFEKIEYDNQRHLQFQRHQQHLQQQWYEAAACEGENNSEEQEQEQEEGDDSYEGGREDYYYYCGVGGGGYGNSREAAAAGVSPGGPSARIAREYQRSRQVSACSSSNNTAHSRGFRSHSAQEAGENDYRYLNKQSTGNQIPRQAVNQQQAHNNNKYDGRERQSPERPFTGNAYQSKGSDNARDRSENSQLDETDKANIVNGVENSLSTLRTQQIMREANGDHTANHPVPSKVLIHRNQKEQTTNHYHDSAAHHEGHKEAHHELVHLNGQRFHSNEGRQALERMKGGKEESQEAEINEVEEQKNKEIGEVCGVAFNGSVGIIGSSSLGGPRIGGGVGANSSQYVANAAAISGINQSNIFQRYIQQAMQNQDGNNQYVNQRSTFNFNFN